MLNENQIGVTNADGSRRLPEVSAISGLPLAPGDPTITFPDSPYFVRIQVSEWLRMNDAEREAMRAEWPRQFPAAPEPSAPTEPPLEDLSLDDLKALAATESIDLAGRSKKADIIAAIRVARVQARFNAPEAGTVNNA